MEPYGIQIRLVVWLGWYRDNDIHFCYIYISLNLKEDHIYWLRISNTLFMHEKFTTFPLAKILNLNDQIIYNTVTILSLKTNGSPILPIAATWTI